MTRALCTKTANALGLRMRCPSLCVLPNVATGEDLAEGASFWHAFITPFWGPETIIIFKRNYVEAMFRLSQIQDKPSKSFDQNQPDTTFGQKLVQSTNVPEVKGYMTKPKRTKISEEHNKILGGIESYGFTYREA